MIEHGNNCHSIDKSTCDVVLHMVEINDKWDCEIRFFADNSENEKMIYVECRINELVNRYNIQKTEFNAFTKFLEHIHSTDRTTLWDRFRGKICKICDKAHGSEARYRCQTCNQEICVFFTEHIYKDPNGDHTDHNNILKTVHENCGGSLEKIK